MVGGAPADADTDACKLARADVHAGSLRAALRLNAKSGRIRNHGVLERAHEVAHRKARALQIDERIDHELPGTVVSHLSAAIDLQHGNVARRDEMRAARAHSEREDRRVLKKPD